MTRAPPSALRGIESCVDERERKLAQEHVRQVERVARLSQEPGSPLPKMAAARLEGASVVLVCERAAEDLVDFINARGAGAAEPLVTRLLPDVVRSYDWLHARRVPAGDVRFENMMVSLDGKRGLVCDVGSDLHRSARGEWERRPQPNGPLMQDWQDLLALLETRLPGRVAREIRSRPPLNTAFSRLSADIRSRCAARPRKRRREGAGEGGSGGDLPHLEDDLGIPCLCRSGGGTSTFAFGDRFVKILWQDV